MNQGFSAEIFKYIFEVFRRHHNMQAHRKRLAYIKYMKRKMLKLFTHP